MREITVAGLKGYESRKKRAEENGTDLHRSGAATLVSRNRKKLTGKNDWYKSRKPNQEQVKGEEEKRGAEGRRKKGETRAIEGKQNPTTVIFVPRTPEGELAKRIRAAEQDLQKFCSSKVKIVEETGNMAKSLVHKANHWAGDDCGRDDCMVCVNGDEKKGDCRRRNNTYLTECRTCLERGEKVRYIGETARSCYERGLEHQRDARGEKEESHVHSHWIERHQGEGETSDQLFRMRIVQGHRAALTRQIQEAVMIANHQGGELLNSKQEYNRCIIPRLAVMVGTRERNTGEDAHLVEKNLVELEESTRTRKREKDAQGQPNNKRRRRWRKEEKETREARQETEHPEARVRYAKRRRLLSSGRQDTIKKWITIKSTEKEKKNERRESTRETREDKDTSREAKLRSQNNKPRGEFKSILEMFRKQEKETKIRTKSETKPSVELDRQLENKIESPNPVQIKTKPRTRLKEAKITKKSQSMTPGNPVIIKNVRNFQNAKKTIPRGEKESPFKQKSEKMKKVADIRTFFESSACKSKENSSQKSSKNVSSGRQLLLAQTAKTYTSKAGRPPSHWRLLCDKNAQGGSSQTSSQENNRLGKPSEKETTTFK